MEDARCFQLLELLAEYGVDYQDMVGGTTKVREIVEDLRTACSPVSNREIRAYEWAKEVWL